MNRKNLFFIIVGFLNATVVNSAVHKDPIENPLFISIGKNFKLHLRSHREKDHPPIAFVLRLREVANSTQLITQDFENLFAIIFDPEIATFLRVLSLKNCNVTIDVYQTLLGYLGRFCQRLQYIDLRGNPSISRFYEGKEQLHGTNFTGASVFYTLIQTDEALDTAIAQASEHDLFEPMQP